ALPKPVQPQGPPVIMGGAGTKRTPALAARFANEFNIPFAGIDDAISMFERVDAACRAIGRDPAGMVRSAALVLCVGRDEGELAKRAAAIGRDVDELRRNGLAGSVSEVVDLIGQWRSRAGV